MVPEWNAAYSAVMVACVSPWCGVTVLPSLSSSSVVLNPFTSDGTRHRLHLTNNTTACMFGTVAMDDSVVNSLTREDVCERGRSHNNEAAIAIEVVDG